MGITKYAIIDEMGYILKSSDDIEEIKKTKATMDNRRTGKSTRTLLHALSVNPDKIVYVVAMNREHAKHLFATCTSYLRDLKFEFESTITTLKIKPLKSAAIIFLTEDRLRGMVKPDVILYDLE
jgi:hypothetical protein